MTSSARTRQSIANCAVLPLNTRNFGIVKCPAIARAFQSVGDRMLLKFVQIGESQREWLLDFAINGQFPFRGLPCRSFEHVIANKKVWHRSQPGIGKLRWHFQIKKAQGTDNHAVLALDGWRTALISGRSPCGKGRRKKGRGGCQRYILKEITS